MALAQEYGKQQSPVEQRSFDRVTLSLIGMGVIFASLGLGEAVYRFAFLDFDGATDRSSYRDVVRARVRLDDYETSWKVLSTLQAGVRQNEVHSGSQLQDSSRGRSHQTRGLSERSSGDQGDS